MGSIFHTTTLLLSSCFIDMITITQNVFFGCQNLMVTAIIHGFVDSYNFTFRCTKMYLFLTRANQPKYRYVLPAIITAGLSDSLLIIIAVVRDLSRSMSLPVLQAIIYIVGLIFLMYMAWTTIGMINPQQDLKLRNLSQ